MKRHAGSGFGRRMAWAALLLWAAVVGQGAEEAPLATRVTEAVAAFQRADSGLAKFFADAVGYAVFPDIGKGGFVIGGARGEGQVFADGQLIGTATLTQVTVGAQVGGQVYSEVVFFQTRAALDDFKASKTKLSAQVSAVAAAEGVAKNAKYHEGVAIFTLAKQGLMAEASAGGQKFKFKPLAP
jgi:lipid-binding SYLF domain-containing protein